MVNLKTIIIIMVFSGIFSVFSTNIRAEINFAQIQSDNMETDLTQAIAIFTDKNHQHTPESIALGEAKNDFKLAKTNNPNFGFNRSTIWVKIPIHNTTNMVQERVISIHYAMIEHLRFFYQSNTGDFHETITGLNYPYYQRPIESDYYAFPITLAAGEKQIFYIEVHSYTPFALPIRLTTFTQFTQFNSHKMLFTGIYVGIMIALILYNLFVFISTRDKAYLFYVFFAFGSAISSIIILGFGYQFWPNATLFNKHLATFSLGLLTVMMIQFCRYFLDTQSSMPNYDKVLKISLYVFSLIAIIITLGGFRHTAGLGYYASMTGATLIIGVIVLGIKYRIQSIIFFVLAWGVLLATAPLAIYSVINILPHKPIFTWIYQLGNAVEAILLSLALADRINTLKQEKVESLKLANEAKLLAESKSNFLATMSHEIRTPMNGILSMSDLLQNADLPPQSKHYAAVINQSGQALVTLINDILDHAKIESKKMRLEIIPFNLDQLIIDCLGIYTLNAKEKSITLLADIHPDVPTYLRGDPNRLRQILLNFLSNAIKFTNQGEITIQITIQEINHQDHARNSKDTTLKIAVKDTGIGIKKPDINKLFQAYSQADKTTYRRFGGTGLGLTISRQLVELMKGEIGVVSNQGEGSEFWIKIPFGISSSKEMHEEPLNLEFLKNKSLLLIEENSHIAELIRKQCDYYNLQISHAKTKAAALNFLANNKQSNSPVDIILYQHQFPGISINDIQLEIERKISWVLLTEVDQTPGSTQNPMVKTILEKPFTPRQLLSALLTAIQPKIKKSVKKDLNELETITFSDCNVLVAEDNEVNQLVIRSILGKFNIKPIIAANGLQALSKAKELHAILDVILMDVEMPKLDGLGATRQLRDYEKSHDLDELPIVGLSAHALSEHQDMCIEAGMNDYLTKPINQQALLQMLQEVLKH